MEQGQKWAGIQRLLQARRRDGGGSSEVGKKWSDSGHILMAKPTVSTFKALTKIIFRMYHINGTTFILGSLMELSL